MKSTGLFAGIGGFELGFRKAGIDCDMLCEIDDAAVSILKKGFPKVEIARDIRELKKLPQSDIIAGGFPCQNLSLVGDKTGIHGVQSSLVNDFFRLVSAQRRKPKWLVLENVPFMLWQKKGEAVRHVIGQFEQLGYSWAYRVVDSRAFGLPQRRRRVLFVASKEDDPREVLFSDEVQRDFDTDDGAAPCGFSWTEGRVGLGWAANAVPTLKGGSSIGIPSLPAIWFRKTGVIATPHICDAERLQGFEVDWTRATIQGLPLKEGFRCKLVGNAVNVPLAAWLGTRLQTPGTYDESRTVKEYDGGTWPNAAWGAKGRAFVVNISEYPVACRYTGLESFLKYPTKMLSHRAATGFLRRARAGGLNFADGFLEAVESHIEQVAD
jgi:DNA (cytosine-5)-methyltransferase 1